MVKVDKFTISKKCYAFKPGTLHENVGQGKYSFYSIEVFYYKKKDGKLCACFGKLWRYAPRGLSNEEEFVNTYNFPSGADMVASWDGTSFIGTQIYEHIVDYVAELKPILKNYPATPEGYTGWFRNS